MKKVLFGTTALVAVAFAGTAFAKDVSLTVGGYTRAGVAFGEFVSGTEQEQSVTVLRDGEIHFKGKGTLDNGLTINVRYELEFFNNSDLVDENWLSVEGSFGEVMIGSNDDAAYNLGVGITSVGINASIQDETEDYTPVGDLGTIGVGDALGIHYYTPNIAGFEAGISWHPDLSSDGGADANNSNPDNDDNVISVGARYSNSFGDFDFALSGGYVFILGEEEDGLAGDDTEGNQFGIGAQVGFAGFTVQGRYEQFDLEEVVSGDDSADGNVYSVGANYGTGPWEFGVAFGYAEDDIADAEAYEINAGVTYELGDGVAASGIIEYGDDDVDSAIGGALLLGVSF